ncbi:SEL1-like repeat protein [Polaromonas eurypsychrophila]|uniref:Uncharacterized protein n=1 Tax=Polaromonas eurypsychrophila TaxID=1614635 RepID=A0A916SLD7_9BURK|nr:hypothetical protein [Polaromonas eurypsychrophila]GGB04820.1 hypothetical protein GCM10011496_27230 [Polaromonas eurypsychrophila]
MGIKDGAHAEDIIDVSGVSSRQRRRKLTFALAVVTITSACIWTAYLWYGKPRLDEHRVNVALQALAAAGEDLHKEVSRTMALPREQMFLAAFDSLSAPSKDLDETLRINGARAALDMAVTEGSDQARLMLGKALRDGSFGPKDSVAALREFDRVRDSSAPGVRAGDPHSLYLHALMLSEGLGVSLDLEAAAAAARRAGEGIAGSLLKEIANQALWGSGVFKNGKDPEWAGRMAKRLVAAGDPSAFRIGVASCDRLHEIVLDPQKADLGLDEAIKRRNACRTPWIKDAAVAGHKPAMADYANTLLSEQGNVEIATQWFEAAGTERSNADNYQYGVLKALSGADLDAVASGVKIMRAALKEEQKSDYPSAFTSFDEVLLLISRMQKVLVKAQNHSRKNFAIALLAHGELEGSMPEAIKAMQVNLGTEHLKPLVSSSKIHRTAALVAEAIRSNKPFVEVAQAQPSGKLVPFSDKLDPPVQRDSEQQAKTGYLVGTKNAASGGLSTFTVDNASGERDAIVRLYLSGKKPAARNFYVKFGEKFTAKSLTPGTYAMRYRFVGSDDTFEADKPFLLSETATESGRRFSNVTVTLYKVRDGNMTTKKIPSEDF